VSSPFVLFEISWEVCNMVGGIHTVISSKAKTATERLGDDYIAVGPWLLSEGDRAPPFDDEPGHEEFCESCRSIGIPVRVGRWRIPSRPRAILIQFSRLYEHKDDVLSSLWDKFEVDSISGGWDYIEPVLFGHAAGIVIERWWEQYLAPRHKPVIVHAHEWMTGSSLLYLKPRLPSVGTVFTTHATMLGRALSSLGHSPQDGLGDQTPAGLAKEHGVTAKHSLEGVCARQADVFTTVSTVTAAEAELLHERRPDPVLPNGIDLDVIDAVAGDTPREEVRAKLLDVAHRFLGEDVSDATLACISGRYEFHNKGIDVVLEALAELNNREGPRIVLFILVPAGNSGVRSEVMERRDLPLEEIRGPVGVATHHLFDHQADPVHLHCKRFQLDNAPGSRIKIIHVPIYLGKKDGFFHEPYEAVLRAMDLSCFPSYYEPWGYTPQESIAVGVPTVTSDYAGFGRWAGGEGLSSESGITILKRLHVAYQESVSGMVGVFEDFLGSAAGTGIRVDVETCRKTASRTAWSDLFANYERAYEGALEGVRERAKAGVPQPRRAPRMVPVPPSKKSVPRLTHFEVVAALPEPLRGLKRIANNFAWVWDPEAVALFEDLSPATWAEVQRNPTALLQQVDRRTLDDKAKDVAYTARIKETLARMRAYLAGDGLCELTEARDGQPATMLSNEHPVAYFSAEFGIHESLPIYGGGLGVLAGDHLKAASDLGLPLVGIGLFYRKGYVKQRVTVTGEQTEVDRINDPAQMPLECVRTAEGAPLEVKIELPGRTLHLRAWRARIGRVSLYLLDADTPSNLDEDRMITERLYGGDAETRILQEIVLGRGGARLIRTLWIRPAAWHLNEGHAAFICLERVARLMREEGLTFDAARELVRATTAFTTHTPVPAGHDRFDEDLMRRYFSDVEEWGGMPWERFYDLGRADDGQFNMTYLAMSFASKVNGVSKLHGIASRQLLGPFWPGLLEDEVPVGSVTNGIHLPTWTHADLAKALGVKHRHITGEDFANAEQADATVLWQTRATLRQALITKVKARLEKTFVARGDSPVTLHKMLEGLDPGALYIGFARRFAPYKRAHLLFQDLERLEQIVDSTDRPVRILIAGKAHPRDQLGKDILKQVVGHTRGEELIGRVFFLEDYDMDLARTLVQGVDIWLNTPTRMLEASGTSGMKASANGVLNLSIADGWWPEAADGKNGWTIGREKVYEDQGLQDQFDGAVLYRLIEEEIVPLFFDCDEQGIPQGWMERVMHNLATIPPVFDTNRMVREYFEKAYRPLGRNYYEYVRDRKARPKHLGAEAQRIRGGFGDIKVVKSDIADLSKVGVGDPITARIEVDLGALDAKDVRVEVVLGRTKGEALEDTVTVALSPTATAERTNGVVSFEGACDVQGSGNYAHGVRIRAAHGDDAGGSLKDLVFWV
jgi:phosphorylase/glycogen(starch) synthase